MIKRINLGIIILLFIGIFLRVVHLDYLELFGDEIDAGYQSYSLIKTGADYKGHFLPIYGQSFSEWRAMGWMYAAIPFIKLFGLNEWGVRMTSAFFGILSIVAVWLILRELEVSSKTKFWTVLFLAISPWHIQYSRSGFELTLMSSMLLFGCLFLIKAIRKNSILFTLLSAMIFSISIYSYNTANVLVPLMCLVILAILRSNKRIFFGLFVFGFIFCIPLLGQILFGHAADRFASVSIFSNKEIVAEVNDYRNAGGSSWLSKLYFNKLVIGGKRLLFNYGNAFGVDFLFRRGDVTFRHSLHKVGNMYWVELPLFLVGLWMMVKSKKRKLKMFLLAWLIISPVASSLTIDGYNHASRLFFMVFPLSVLAAIGLNRLGTKFKYLVVLVLMFEFVGFQYYHWSFYKNESWRWWHTGYKQAMQYVGKNQDKYDRVFIDNTYEPSLIRYLFWNRIDPKMVNNLRDKMDQDIDGYRGFCLDKKVCFVDFGNNFFNTNIGNNNIYLISQERNVGGDWDLSKNPTSSIEVLKTVRNNKKDPIFYLIKGK